MTYYAVLRTPSGPVCFRVNESARDDEPVLVREEDMRKEVMCVQHREGWCALEFGATLDPAAANDPTACGHSVIFRIGSEVRTPDCPDCLKALEDFHAR